MKKKKQNQKRSKPGPQGDSEVEPEEEGTSSGPEEAEFDAAMVEHLRMVTSQIEGRSVSRDEVLEMLKRVMRQRSIGQEKRSDYIVRFLKENPP